jgi:hypothetical protein
MNYEDILQRIQRDPAYLANLDWGEPRSGHPEGSIRRHIADLEENLARLRPRLSDGESWKLRLLIHSHDTFKPDAKTGVAITHAGSHAALAKKFLSGYVSDAELLNIVQFHDEPFALWRKQRGGGDCSQRLQRLTETITDWDLFLGFLIVDGCTAGKSTAPLEWFFSRIRNLVDSRIDETWIEIVANPQR